MLLPDANSKLNKATHFALQSHFAALCLAGQVLTIPQYACNTWRRQKALFASNYLMLNQWPNKRYVKMFSLGQSLLPVDTTTPILEESVI